MTLDVVVPVRRLRTVDRLMRSLSAGVEMPDCVTLVSNELDLAANIYRFPVRTVRFESTAYAVGESDVALRRNVGLWASNADDILFLDDDVVAPCDLIASLRTLRWREPFVWGHHRYIDFETVHLRELATLRPSAGRSREHPPNAWHTWRSCYAGAFAAPTSLLKEVGGFDMLFAGGHGGEDQDLGRRLALRLGGGSRVFVHEPPFAWHPERPEPWDAAKTNCCDGPHDLFDTDVDGVRAVRCHCCPYRRRLDDPPPRRTEPVDPFDPGNVSLRVEATF